jgi:hypothetical protein
MILNEQNSKNSFKSDQHQVQDQQKEYKLFGQYARTRGLFLFGFDDINNELYLVEVRLKETIELQVTKEGMQHVNSSTEDVTVDGNHIYFEALNTSSAMRRVIRYKSGKIKELCNLRKPNKQALNFFK